VIDNASMEHIPSTHLQSDYPGELLDPAFEAAATENGIWNTDVRGRAGLHERYHHKSFAGKVCCPAGNIYYSLVY